MQAQLSVRAMLIGTFVLLLVLVACSCCEEAAHSDYAMAVQDATRCAELNQSPGAAARAGLACADWQVQQELVAVCRVHCVRCLTEIPWAAQTVIAEGDVARSCPLGAVAMRAAATQPPPSDTPISPVAKVVRPKEPDTPTYTPTPTDTPTPLPPAPPVVAAPPPSCVTPPEQFDPPNGKNFAAANTVFRWKPGSELGPDQVYDVLVSTDGGKTSTSVGTTRDTNLPIDFLKWDLAGMTGDFSWTVRIRDASGNYVSCEGKWLAMTLTEIKGGVPGVPAGPQKPCHDPPKCSW